MSILHQNNVTSSSGDMRKHAFDNSSDNLIIIDPRLMWVVDANQSALSILGYSRDELINLKLRELDANYSEAAISAAFDNIINSKEPSTIIATRHIKKDKTVIDVEVCLRCFNDDEPVFILASIAQKSVSPQALVEVRFSATLLDNISDAVISTDENFMFTSWNKSAEEIFGWSAKEVIGKPSTEFTATVYPNQTAGEVAQHIRDTGSWNGEVLAHKKDGKIIPITVSIGVITNSDNKPMGYVTVARDIPERNKPEAELRHLNEELEKLVNEKTEQLKNVFERISDGFVAFDTDWNYTYLNEKVIELTGKKKEELLGKNNWAVFPELVGTELYERYHLSMSTQQASRITYFNPDLHRYFELSLYPSKRGLSVYFHDITEEKLHEQKLKESEEKYRTIVESAHEGILQIDENNNVMFLNRQLANFIGYSVEEIIGKSTLSLLPKEKQELALSKVENRKKGISEQYEMSLFSKDGKLVHTLINARPLFKDKTYAGSILTIMDITERKLSQAKIQENEKRLNALFENSSDGIILFSKEGNILEINPAVEKIMGYNKEELEIKRSAVLVPEHLPLMINTIKEVLSNDAIAKTIEYQVLRPGGNRKWVRATFRNMISNPDIGAIVTNFVDIDESKKIQEALTESEARYRRAQSQGKMGHWRRDVSNGSVTWSEQVYKIFELQEAEPILNYKDFLNMVHPDDREFVTKEHKLALNECTEFDLFYRIVTPKGSLKHLHEVADISKDDHGKPMYLSGMVQDVTEQKLVEEQLSHNRHELASILNNIVDAVSLVQVEGKNKFRYVAVNDAYTKVNKIEREKALGRLVGELMPEHSFDKLFELFNEAIKSGEVQKYESITEWFQGLAAFELTIVPITNHAGIFDRILVIAKDITEKKLSEQKLIKSEENNRVLFEQTPVPIWLLDKDLNFIRVNETAVAEYGYSMEEFLSMNLMQIKLAEDHAFLENKKENPDEARTYAGVTRHLLKNGEIIYSRVHSTTLRVDDENVILVASKNITPEMSAQRALIENEQQLSLIFDSTKDAMWLLKVEDLDNYRIEVYNRSYELLTGIEKESWVGKLINEVFPPEHSERSIAKYKQVVQSGNIGSDFVSLKTAGGEVTAEITITPIKDIKGNVVRLLGSAVDVTQQQKARKELIKMNLELRELASHLQNVREEERTNIAREIHDELGQQLTGLKMDLAWLKKKINVEEELIINKVDSSLQLIDGTINTVRKIASALRPSIIDDLGIKEALNWHCQEFSKRTGIQVNFVSGIDNLDLPKAIPTALFRLVQEALTNVARHSKATAVSCSLECGNNELLLSISDNGQGFSLFTQERKTLGLLGMRERVAILNGEYHIDSEPGQGTKILIKIPVKH